MKVTVVGLWHLGPVNAACAANAGHIVVGVDDDDNADVAFVMNKVIDIIPLLSKKYSCFSVLTVASWINQTSRKVRK